MKYYNIIFMRAPTSPPPQGGVHSLLSILILPILAEDCSFMCSFFFPWLFLKLNSFCAAKNGSGSQARNGSIMPIRVPNKPAKLVALKVNHGSTSEGEAGSCTGTAKRGMSSFLFPSATQKGQISGGGDGRNPAFTSWYGKYPIIYRVLIHPRWLALGFLNHQP